MSRIPRILGLCLAPLGALLLSPSASAQTPTPIKVSYQIAYWALPIYIATEKNWWAEAA